MLLSVDLAACIHQPTLQVVLCDIQDLVLAGSLISLFLSALQPIKQFRLFVRAFRVTPDLQAGDS